MITPSECKAIVPEINFDISDLLINNAIKMVQSTLLIDTVGQEWADELMSQTGTIVSGVTSGETYTTANEYIVDNYLKNILAYSVWQYLVITLSLQLNSAGLRIKTSDHSVASESKDLAFYRDFCQNYIDRTRKLMHRYIDQNKASYPLYFNNIYHDVPKVYNFKIGHI
jgi:hypothetical protein